MRSIPESQCIFPIAVPFKVKWLLSQKHILCLALTPGVREIVRKVREKWTCLCCQCTTLWAQCLGTASIRLIHRIIAQKVSRQHGLWKRKLCPRVRWFFCTCYNRSDWRVVFQSSKTSLCTADSARYEYWGCRSLGGILYQVRLHTAVFAESSSLSHKPLENVLWFLYPQESKAQCEGQAGHRVEGSICTLGTGCPCSFLPSQHAKEVSWSCALSWRHWETRSQHTSEHMSCVNLIFCPWNRK